MTVGRKSARAPQVDAVVAGGGIAGCAAAAALAEAGLSVLVVEPGQHADRRLSGELLHPPGLLGLKALGFVPPQAGPGAAAIRGFCVFHDQGGSDAPTTLPYPCDGATGLAMDHGALRKALTLQLRGRPGVTLLEGARVIDLDLADLTAPVAILRQGDETSRIAARIIVAADGAASQVRARAGIGHRRRPLSTLLGFLADRAALPVVDHGHLFLGAARPALAYAIGSDRARVMFDLPLGSADTRRDWLEAAVAALPLSLRDAMDPADLGAGLSYVSHEVSVETAARGRVMLVGDAAGSCHPLTATGMTVAVTDGLCLQAALRACPGSPDRALALYRRRRRTAQRARRLLAGGLYEAFSVADPSALLMRRGLQRYWQADARARAASMALLAMMDVRFASAVREMLRVALHGAAADQSGRSGAVQALLPLREPRLVLGAAALMVRHMQAALWAR